MRKLSHRMVQTHDTMWYEEPVEEDELSDHSDAFDHSDDEGEFMLRNRSVVAPTTVEHNQDSPSSAASSLQPCQRSPFICTKE